LIEPAISTDEDTMNIDITKEHYTTQFKLILEIYQQLVSKSLSSKTPSSTSSSSSPNSDPVVIDATKCIAAMCKLICF
jgi:hypothetical protein